jgi:hypothetical protein
VAIITSEVAAQMLSTPDTPVSVRRVQQLAKELNLPRLGRQFVITDKDVRKMAARKTQRGPEKGAKK